MHIVTDEHGNPIPHGGHEYTHEEHSHEGHSHEHGEAENKHTADKSKVMLEYTIRHNEQHLDEMVVLAKDLREGGNGNVAELVDKAAEEFAEGVTQLRNALKVYEKERE